MKTKNRERARLALAELEKEMEILTKEEMSACKGGGSEDIIILFDPNGANRYGHAGLLIGSERDGWRYFSVNGTESEKGSLYGNNYQPDKGEKVYANWKDVNQDGKFKYSKYIRIKTTPEEDTIAIEEAKKQTSVEKYNIFGSSCIDVPQEVLKAVFEKREKEIEGDNMLIPNEYYKKIKKYGEEYGYF